jgi:deferrochelatase/peroxidase EfeB
LPDGRVHFGYRDGISEPALVGGPEPSFPYPNQLGVNGRSPWGDFILGYPNSFNEYGYSWRLAETGMGKNGSFGAFRILKQDVTAFFDYLKMEAARAKLTSEQIAAKLLGRWSNGVPLTLSPNSDSPVPEDRLNMFLYQADACGQADPDPIGIACPEGGAYPARQSARRYRGGKLYPGAPHHPAQPALRLRNGIRFAPTTDLSVDSLDISSTPISETNFNF